jgi:PTH1 family peptidyl-tRNA hydrolase
MYYIVGLGNPGTEYSDTRHNVGFFVLEHLAESSNFSSWHKSGSHGGNVTTGELDGTEVTLLLPTTFMNESGVAVRMLVPKGKEECLVVVYDDVDLAFGELKVSFDRGAGGHNGMKSIIERLGTTAFVRVRVGVAQKSIFTGSLKRPKGEALPKFVLAPFTTKEKKQLEDVLKKAAEAVVAVVTEGREKASNKFN